MSGMRTKPCDWPIDYAACPSCKPLDDLGSAKGRKLFENMATEYLWRWSGRVFGLCEKTVRPCRTYQQYGGSSFTGSGAPWTPVIVSGEWVNITCGSCFANDCGCETFASIVLPGPIAEISKVTINGTELPDTSYRISGTNRLIRTDGNSWPTYQDLTADAGQPDTFIVEYESGVKVPVGGQVAAGILACEFAKAAVNDASCQLPKRLQSITRQGVSMAILDNFDDLDTGHTGIWLIDSWLASVSKPPARSRVYSPDVKKPYSVR